MKKVIITLTVVFVAAIALYAQEYTSQKIITGQKAPDLISQSPEGTTVKLSEMSKGRVVLLDFWASWCGPCRRSSPGLVALYNKYKDQKFKGAKNGFTVVSVSLDQNKEAWVKAIADDHYTWPYHMSDLKSWSSDVASVYGIQSIPQCFLIDVKGNIVGKYFLAEHAAEDIEKLMTNGKLDKK